MLSVKLVNNFEEKLNALRVVKQMGLLDTNGKSMEKVMTYIKCLVADYNIVPSRSYFETRMRKQVGMKLIGLENCKMYEVYNNYIEIKKVEEE